MTWRDFARMRTGRRVDWKLIELSVAAPATSRDGAKVDARASSQAQRAPRSDSRAKRLHRSRRSQGAAQHDTDASVYWLARMVEAGRRYLYIARRLCGSRRRTRNADPQA